MDASGGLTRLRTCPGGPARQPLGCTGIVRILQIRQTVSSRKHGNVALRHNTACGITPCDQPNASSNKAHCRPARRTQLPRRQANNAGPAGASATRPHTSSSILKSSACARPPSPESSGIPRRPAPVSNLRDRLPSAGSAGLAACRIASACRSRANSSKSNALSPGARQHDRRPLRRPRTRDETPAPPEARTAEEKEHALLRRPAFQVVPRLSHRQSRN